MRLIESAPYVADYDSVTMPLLLFSFESAMQMTRRDVLRHFARRQTRLLAARPTHASRSFYCRISRTAKTDE